MRFSLLPNYSLVLFLSCVIILGGCAGNTHVQPKAVAAAGGDTSTNNDAADYPTKQGADGQTIVGDDYFNDDDHLDDYSAKVIIPDPLEPWNRFWFKFNDLVLEYAGKPVNKAYDFVVPEVGRKGLKNFFHNLRTPARFVNCILQGKGMEAGVEFSSFFLNTIFGLGGFIDLASQYKPVGMETDEDLGQTFGVWGVGEGVYLVWPLLGPSNIRDSVGMVGDYFIGYYTNPITQFGKFDWTVEVGISALSALNSLSDVLKMYDTFKETAIDPYTSMRDGYTQLRRSRVAK